LLKVDINKKFPIEQEENKLLTHSSFSKNRDLKWKSKFFIKLTPWQKFYILMSNKAYVYLLIAAFFRFAGGYSLGYWSKDYF